MKRRKRRKDVCKYDRKKLYLDYTDCPFCGGDEYYTCPKCGRQYDLDGKEI